MKRPLLPNSEFHRASVRCVCGRPLMDMLDHPAGTDGSGPASRVQVDCPRCQYLVFLLYRWQCRPCPKRDVLVVHTVDLRSGAVIVSEVFLGARPGDRRGDRGGMRAPAGDLQEAVGRPWARELDEANADARSSVQNGALHVPTS